MILYYLVLYYGLSDWRGWIFFKTSRPGFTGCYRDTAKFCLEYNFLFLIQCESINMLHISNYTTSSV